MKYDQERRRRARMRTYHEMITFLVMSILVIALILLLGKAF